VTSMLALDGSAIAKDIEVRQLRTNASSLAKAAVLCNIPVIATSANADGPNGPLMPEIREAAPKAVYVQRHGELNAWDDPRFVEAVHHRPAHTPATRPSSKVLMQSFNTKK
jgi:nicotinamidase-related amidase